MGGRAWDLPVDEHIRCIAYMPDGRTIAAASTRSVMLIDPTLGHVRQLWRRSLGDPRADRPTLAVSPDGRHIACTVQKTILVLDATSGAMTSLKHDEMVYCVAYSPDGTRIAAGTKTAAGKSGGIIRLWDGATGAACGQDLSEHTDDVTGISFSPDGSCLASSDYVGTIRLWDIRTCTPTATLERPDHVGRIYKVEFWPDGMHIAALYKHDIVLFRDVRASATIRYVWEQSSEGGNVAFSPSGRYIAAVSEVGIQIWDVQDRCKVGAPLIGSEGCGYITSIVFSPDGRSIAVSLFDEILRVWDLFV